MVTIALQKLQNEIDKGIELHAWWIWVRIKVSVR